MTRLTPDDEPDAVGGGVQGAGAGFHHAHGMGGHHMQAVDAIHMRILHRPCLYHGFGAAVGFLGRLEEQLHLAVEPVLHAIEHPGRAQQDGGMRVMPAGMHHALMLGAEGTAIRLLKGQRVHIGAKADGIAGQRALNQPDDPRALGGIGNTDLIQRIHDGLLCLKFSKAPLGNPVELPAHGNDPVLFLFNQRQQFLHVHGTPPVSPAFQ